MQRLPRPPTHPRSRPTATHPQMQSQTQILMPTQTQRPHLRHAHRHRPRCRPPRVTPQPRHPHPHPHPRLHRPTLPQRQPSPNRHRHSHWSRHRQTLLPRSPPHRRTQPPLIQTRTQSPSHPHPHPHRPTTTRPLMDAQTHPRQIRPNLHPAQTPPRPMHNQILMLAPAPVPAPPLRLQTETPQTHTPPRTSQLPTRLTHPQGPRTLVTTHPHPTSKDGPRGYGHADHAATTTLTGRDAQTNCAHPCQAQTHDRLPRTDHAARPHVPAPPTRSDRADCRPPATEDMQIHAHSRLRILPHR